MTPHTLPTDWQWVTLGEICEINPKTETNGFADSQIVSFIPMKCVQEQSNHFTTENRLYKEVKKGYTKFQNHDILFAKITPCMENGKVCVVNNLIDEKGFGSTEFHIFRSNQEKVLPLFIFFFVIRQSFLKAMEYQMTGAVGQKRIRADIIADTQIPLPPLEIQKQIVEVLESKLEKIQEIKALLESSLKDCETYRASLLESAFRGELTPHSTDWQWVRLEEIGKIITGSTPNKAKQEFYGNDYPLFKPTDLEAGYYTQKARDNVSSLGFQQGREIPKKSILVTCIGATIGKTGFTRVKGICNQQINAIIPDSKKILGEFIYFYCISPILQMQILSSYHATTLPILKKSLFAKLLIPLPPLEIQKQIVEVLESKLEKIQETKALLESSLKDCETYRASLLESAFRGELV